MSIDLKPARSKWLDEALEKYLAEEGDRDSLSG